MPYGFLDVAVTPSVRAAQAAMKADHLWEDFTGNREFDRFSEREAAFISDRDSMYIATVSETGWPYVQHRGGPRGFVKIVDDRMLAFADYRGNRQYISVGNLSVDSRACLFLMDYTRRARMKIYAHIQIVELDADAGLTEFLSLPGYDAKCERIFVVRLKNFDWNCSQHITQRFTEAEVAESMLPLRERLEQLEAENAGLRARFASTEINDGN